MSAKHTPGPWVVHKTEKDALTIKYVEEGGYHVATINTRHRRTVQAHADAALIAAAPQMLEALRAVGLLIDQMIPAARFMGTRRKDKFAQIEEAERLVLAAIAAAKRLGNHVEGGA